MKRINPLLVIALALTGLIMQSCVLAPNAPDPHKQQVAFERWNRCIQRFDAGAEHYCDGHRRDILATYPVHHENQINTLLSQKSRELRASKLIKTGLGSAPAAVERKVQKALREAIDIARQSDL